eukprot:1608627-Prymnesium_polylepis.1
MRLIKSRCYDICFYTKYNLRSLWARSGIAHPKYNLRSLWARSGIAHRTARNTHGSASGADTAHRG